MNSENIFVIAASAMSATSPGLLSALRTLDGATGQHMRPHNEVLGVEFKVRTI